MRPRVTPRTALYAALLVLPLALAGCGGLRNEATALGLADTAPTVQRPELAPDVSFARGQEAEAADNFEAAEQFYIAAANAGSIAARVSLGALYLAGRGVNRDYAEALHWLEPAARAGNADAQARVGLIYETGGVGVTRAPDTALLWYERAAAQGNASAQYRAGHILLQAILGHEDPARALKLFRAAAAQNHPQALTSVGMLYLQGRGIPSDAREAVIWLKRGADANDPDAMLQLGRLYWEGQQVPKNIPEGTRLLRRAAELGSEQARHELALPPS